MRRVSESFQHLELVLFFLTHIYCTDFFFFSPQFLFGDFLIFIIFSDDSLNKCTFIDVVLDDPDSDLDSVARISEAKRNVTVISRGDQIL